MTFTLPPLLPCYRLERICRYDPNYLNPNSHPFGRFETATDQLRKCDAIIQVIFGFVRVVNPVLTDLFSSASPFWSPRSRGYGLSFLLQFPHPRPHSLVTLLCSNNPLPTTRFSFPSLLGHSLTSLAPHPPTYFQ